MSYEAYVEVDNYDCDFMLLFDGEPIYEEARSPRVTAETPAAALREFLSRLSVSDYNRRYKPGEVPQSYRHVGAVREWLDEMRSDLNRGRIPEDRMHWGGNWDVQFYVGEAGSRPEAAPDPKMGRAVEIADLLIRCVDMLLPGAGKLALSGEDIADLNQALIMGRRFVAEHRDG